MGPAFLLGLVAASIIMCWGVVCCACKAAVHGYSRGAIFIAEGEEDDVPETTHCITPYPRLLLVHVAECDVVEGARLPGEGGK